MSRRALRRAVALLLLDTEEVEEDWKATMAEGATSAARRIVDNMDCIVERVGVVFESIMARQNSKHHIHHFFWLGRTEVHAQDLRGRRKRGAYDTCNKGTRVRKRV